MCLYSLALNIFHFILDFGVCRTYPTYLCECNTDMNDVPT